MRMLSVFPQILFLAPLSATILRIAAGFVFLYLAYVHFGKRTRAADEIAPIVGGARVILVIYSLIELVVGICLIIGLWTQAAALIGFLIGAKMLIIRKALKDLKPISELSYFLLAVICLSLLFTGAGAFAFDLPL